MPERKHVNLKLEMIGGASAGVVGTVIGYPLDLVKTRMQTSLISNQESFIRVGYRIARQEGITALYKGMIPPLISLSILNVSSSLSDHMLLRSCHI
jgi:solute carrier family 25 carnitine/acylcarnitine transporter 20/29